MQDKRTWYVCLKKSRYVLIVLIPIVLLFLFFNAWTEEQSKDSQKRNNIIQTEQEIKDQAYDLARKVAKDLPEGFTVKIGNAEYEVMRHPFRKWFYSDGSFIRDQIWSPKTPISHTIEFINNLERKVDEKLKELDEWHKELNNAPDSN